MIWFARSVFMLAFSMENYNIHKKRLKQLQFSNKKPKTDADLVDQITKPIIKHIISRLKPADLDKIQKKLQMAKWEKSFTPVQFRAMNIFLKIAGVIVFLIMWQIINMFVGIVIGLAVMFSMNFLMGNSIKNRKQKLIADFPDFIRITEGYLTAKIPFSRAIEEAIKYVGDEWKPILQTFVVETDTKSMREALDNLRDSVDMFEVREFVALVKLTLEQGGDAKDSFTAQAEKIREMQMDIIAIKIGRRKVMGTFVQMPLLLTNLMVFGLPTVASMANFTTM